MNGVPFVVPEDALRFLRERLPLPSDTLERLIARARERGTRISRTFAADLQGLVDEQLRTAALGGQSVGQFTRELNDVFNRMGIGEASPHRLQTIFRNNLNTAFTAGRLEFVNHPDVTDVFLFQQYHTIGDSAVRPNHAAMDGRVFRRDDPIWRIWTPPNGHNCRCSVTFLTQEDVDAEGLRVEQGSAVSVRPDPGFETSQALAFATGSAAAGL